jgi:predicted RNA binding protein YcfA (HicA-like mRNA interferase family)
MGKNPVRIKYENARRVIQRLEGHGFNIVRSKGSHQQLLCSHKSGCHHLVTVAIHGSKDLSPDDTRSIIRQSGLTTAQFYSK